MAVSHSPALRQIDVAVQSGSRCVILNFFSPPFRLWSYTHKCFSVYFPGEGIFSFHLSEEVIRAEALCHSFGRAKLHHNIMHQIISVKHEQNSISSHSFHSAPLQYLHCCLFHSCSLSSLSSSSFSYTCLPILPPLQPFLTFHPRSLLSCAVLPLPLQ